MKLIGLVMLWPRQAGKFIASKAMDIKISENGIKECSLMIVNSVKEKKLRLNEFKQNAVFPLDIGLTQQQLVDWVFLVDSLNFNFWTPNGISKYIVTHNGQTCTGYMGMVMAINRAISEGKPIYDPLYYSKLSLDDVKHIFRSDTESQMPLLEKRVEIAAEVGNILKKNYEGNFINVLKLCDGSAMKLVDIVTKEFPSFRDIHTFEGEEVAIFKRAQILAADIALLYEGKDLGNFYDIDQLTMFADYRVPQALKYFGVLSYSDSLMEKLENDHLFPCGSREEVEIRGVSIHAVELIVGECKQILEKWNLQDDINSIKVDYFLWDYRYTNSDKLETVPYHKTRCIYY